MFCVVLLAAGRASFMCYQRSQMLLIRQAAGNQQLQHTCTPHSCQRQPTAAAAATAVTMPGSSQSQSSTRSKRSWRHCCLTAHRCHRRMGPWMSSMGTGVHSRGPGGLAQVSLLPVLHVLQGSCRTCGPRRAGVAGRGSWVHRDVLVWW